MKYALVGLSPVMVVGRVVGIIGAALWVGLYVGFQSVVEAAERFADE